MLWPLALCAVTGGILVMPLLPAILEWRRKTDASPLRIYRKDEGDVRHFARTFRQFVRDNMGEALQQAAADGEPRAGTVGAALRYQVVGRDGRPELAATETALKSTERMLLSSSALRLPPYWLFKGDLYCEGVVYGSEGSIYRAILAGGDIRLAESSTVLRWLHTDGSLFLAPGCTLYGRASAEDRIVLATNARFHRLHAPIIMVGDEGGGSQDEPAASPAPPGPRSRWLVRGDVELPPGTCYDGDVVASGNIWIGAGTRITGSVKSNRHLRVERGCILQGAVVAAEDLRLGPDCRVKGPAVAEATLEVQTGSVIGSKSKLTSVTAPHIAVAPGVAIHGTLWARESGRTA